MNQKLSIYIIMLSPFLYITSITLGSPLAKITIKSKKAFGKKNHENKDWYEFSYLDDVHTTLADGSTITADKLTVTFQKHRDPSLQKKKTDIHTINYEGHVIITRQYQRVTAQRAAINPEKQHCMLSGSVYVEQTKQKGSDIPLTLSSETAEISLITGEVTFIGSDSTPVHSIIDISEKKFLNKKNKKLLL